MSESVSLVVRNVMEGKSEGVGKVEEGRREESDKVGEGWMVMNALALPPKRLSVVDQEVVMNQGKREGRTWRGSREVLVDVALRISCVLWCVLCCLAHWEMRPLCCCRDGTPSLSTTPSVLVVEVEGATTTTTAMTTTSTYL